MVNKTLSSSEQIWFGSSLWRQSLRGMIVWRWYWLFWLQDWVGLRLDMSQGDRDGGKKGRTKWGGGDKREGEGENGRDSARGIVRWGGQSTSHDWWRAVAKEKVQQHLNQQRERAEREREQSRSIERAERDQKKREQKKKEQREREQSSKLRPSPMTSILSKNAYDMRNFTLIYLGYIF